MNPSGKILIIISALNEGVALATTLPQLKEVVGDSADILLVSDCSSDNTAAVAKDFATFVIDHPKHRGKMACIRDGMATGLSMSVYEYFITMDGDGQHDPAFIPEIVKLLGEHDVVFTSRYREDSPPGVGHPPLDRWLLNRSCRAMVDGVTGWELTDPLCGLRGFRREVVEWIMAQSYTSPDGYGFEIETVIRLWHRASALGQPVRYTEIAHPAIYQGNGKIGTIYTDEHLEGRLERVKMHMKHVVLALRDLGVTVSTLPRR